MIFEWDEAKRRENLRVRDVDFTRAVLVFDDPKRIEIADGRRDYGEARFIVVGAVKDETYAVVYTLRGETYRIITAWRMREDGRRRYQAIYDRRNKRDE